jgi:autotransporter translocation and assembly factor TamB
VNIELSSARPVRRVGLLHKHGDIDWHDVNAPKASLSIESTDFFMPDPQWFCVTAEGEGTFQDAPLLAHASPFFTSHPK